MKKLNVILHYRHFPIAMGRYIHWGLENLGHKVYSVGEYSGGKIPWGDQYYYPNHKMPPTRILPAQERYPIWDVLRRARIDGFDPDVVIQAGDVCFLEGKADVPNIIIGTDPHCIDYHPRLLNADYFVSMQHYYLKDYPQGIWMPYGYDKDIHIPLRDIKKRYEVVFCGLQYSQRLAVLDEVKRKGVRTFIGMGLIYDDYVKVYNKGDIAFNWSSQLDLPARFWEALAMKRCLITNRVPDMTQFPELIDGVDYIGFDTHDEAVEKILHYAKHPQETKKIALSGYKKLLKGKHTYTDRLEKMLDQVGLCRKMPLR